MKYVLYHKGEFKDVDYSILNIDTHFFFGILTKDVLYFVPEFKFYEDEDVIKLESILRERKEISINYKDYRVIKVRTYKSIEIIKVIGGHLIFFYSDDQYNRKFEFENLWNERCYFDKVPERLNFSLNDIQADCSCHKDIGEFLREKDMRKVLET
jgi:hypothetical protein